MIALGIDLGATAVRCAACDGDRAPALVPDATSGGLQTTPLVVVDGDTALVGDLAAALDDHEATETVHAPLRRLSEDEADAEWTSEALLALVFRKIERDARSHLHVDVGVVGVAVDLDAGETERRRIAAAVAISGIGACALVDRPAAIATHAIRGDGPALVVDLGASAARLTVLRRVNDAWSVDAHLEDPHLGGDAVERGLAAALVGTDAGPAEIRATSNLREQLMDGNARAAMAVAMTPDGPRWLALTRSQFECAVRSILESLAQRCADLVKSTDVEMIALAGCGASLPGLVEVLAAKLGIDEERFIRRQPEFAAAFGAAELAAALPPERRMATASEGAVDDIGVRTWDAERDAPGIDVLIHRGAAVPAVGATTIYTKTADQRRVVVEIVRVADCEPESVGRFAFGPIRRPRANLPLEVELTLSAEGVLQATARSPETGEQIDCEFAGDEASATNAEKVREMRIE